MSKSLKERFNKKHELGPNGCWLWTGAVSGCGYGSIKNNGKMVNAHRVAWELYHGALQTGSFVCHRCDVRACVNPDHLFLGSHTDNMLDMAAKGRGRPACLRGERNPRATLTSDTVLAVMAAAGSNVEVATRFNISNQQVSRIRNGKCWTHLTKADV